MTADSASWIACATWPRPFLAPILETRYREVMSAPTIDAIRDAISRLPKDDKVSLTAWLSLEMTDAWDRQMQRDFSPGGRGAKFQKRVKAEVATAARKGTLRPLSEGFAERRKRS
jgi:hypothetical protein